MFTGIGIIASVVTMFAASIAAAAAAGSTSTSASPLATTSPTSIDPSSQEGR
jgi:hypothetical protein